MDFEDAPSDGALENPDGFSVLQQDIEINKEIKTNKSGINIGDDESAVIVQKPQMKEIVIPPPKAEGKKRPSPIEKPKKAEFIF